VFVALSGTAEAVPFPGDPNYVHNGDQQHFFRHILTPIPEERLEQFCAAARQYASADFRPVIQLGVAQHLHHRMDCACFGVVRAVDQSFQPGVHQGAGAHGARFNCSKEFAVSEAVVAQGGAGFSQGDDFRVGGRVAVGEVAIPASTDDLAVMYHDSAHGNLAGFQGALCGAKGFLHPEFVRGWSWVVGHSSLVSARKG
jgi:hypothetical protein